MIESWSEPIDVQSSEAFAAIARRYVNLVYSTARRIVGDEQLAEDVTQAALLVLMKKLNSIDPKILSGWLVNTARLTAKAALRAKHCREKHEARAAQMVSMTKSSQDEPTADNLMPLLDDALSRLNDADRSAVVMRFLQGLSFAEVGTAMGSSEDAARKRVSRAVDKLRAIFMKRGIIPSIGGLMMVLASQQATRAPAATIGAITTATAARTGANIVFAKGAMRAMKLAKIKFATVILLAIAISISLLGMAIKSTDPATTQSLPSNARANTSYPSQSGSTPQSEDKTWETFVSNFDKGRATIQTLSAQFNVIYEINIPANKATTGTIFWALDGDKEMLEKNGPADDYVKSVFDGEVRCDIEGSTEGTKQVQIIARPNFNITNIVDRFFFGTGFFRHTLSDELRAAADTKKYALSIDRRSDQGRAITEIKWSKDNDGVKTSESLWFDTTKNAVIRFEGDVDGFPQVIDTIDEMREVSPGLWIPVKFTETIQNRTANGESRWSQRRTYTTQELHVNGPVASSLFDTTPPGNSFVRDERTGKVWRIP